MIGQEGGGWFRRRYRIVLHGEGIYIPQEEHGHLAGFYATRFIRAASPQQAAALAIGLLRNEWFNSPYSTVDRSGGPTITVKEVEMIRNPFRRSGRNRGYDFYLKPDLIGDPTT
jgi:hypothetical protein